MRMIKKVHGGLFLLLIFALTCIRVVARVLPISRTARAAKREALAKGVHRSLLVRNAKLAGSSYAMEATGSFPYVKLVSVSAQAVPVPVEMAGLSAPVGPKPAATKKAAHALTRKAKPAAAKIFCDPSNCSDCTDCGGCTDCVDCTTTDGCSCTTTDFGSSTSDGVPL